MRLSIPAAKVAALLSVLFANELPAQDVQPRIYVPAPVGINVVTLGYSFSSGGVLFDKTIPIEDATGDIHSITVAYSRSIGIFGMSGRADLALPFVTGKWAGSILKEGQTTSRTGFGDPVVRLAVFFLGAPALTREQFAHFSPRTIVGATVRIGMPLGQYDASRTLNLGSNRWLFSPQIGVSHLAGRLVLDAYASAWLFTDNTEFLGSGTLSQNPLYAFQLHVAYRFRPGCWLAASSRQSLGGATVYDDGDKLTPEANNRVGLTLAYRIESRYTVKLAVTTGLVATAGNDYTTATLAWQIAL